jgi:WD40 repeat protein
MSILGKHILVWQLDPGALQSTLKRHSESFNCVVFSTDGRLIASGLGDGTVKIWDITIVDSECNQVVHTYAVKRYNLSPNEKHVASCSTAQSGFGMWIRGVCNIYSRMTG